MSKFKISAKCIIVLVCWCFSQVSMAQVIKEERSLYRNIFVEDIGDSRCLKFSVKRKNSSQSCIYKSAPHKLVFTYTKFVMSALMFNAQPEKVLIIGLGGGTLSNNLLQLYPDIHIDNVEIDPAVVKVASDYFDFKENDKVVTYIQDGRIFIKRALLKKSQYDLIILDAFNGEYIPEHLLTKEFLEETQGLLSERGILVSNTFSTSRLYHHESATYHAVFGDFYSIKDLQNSGNRVIVAAKNLPSIDSLQVQIESLKQPLSQFDIELEKIIGFVQLEKNSPSEYRVLTDQYSPANLL